MTRPSRVVTPTGESFDMPAGPPVAAADRTTLLDRVYLSTVNEQRQRALKLLADIDAYLGKGGR